MKIDSDLMMNSMYRIIMDYGVEILDSIDTALCVYDENGCVLYGSKFEERFGIELDECIGKSAKYLIEQGYADRTPVNSTLASGRTTVMYQKTATGQHLRVKTVPFLKDDSTIELIIESCIDIYENERLKTKLKEKEREIEQIRVQSKSIKELEGEFIPPKLEAIRFIPDVEQKILKVSKTDATMLILGESGTGKTHLAHYIHKSSKRADGPFISINCSTIADNLFESELFGYEAGAFTGAKNKGKNGLVELANSGTLFLDEIGEVPLHLQGKLLELIQEKRYIPVGALRYKHVDVKIITATNQNLKELVEKKSFREDLYYRLRVIEFVVPPLRDRRETIEAFANYFTNIFNIEYNCHKSISNDVKSALLNYHWPGNIRELKNLIHGLIIMCSDNEIKLSDLPDIMVENSNLDRGVTFGNLGDILEQHKREIVEKCFRFNSSSRKLAKALNISQTNANRLIKKYNLKQE